MKSVKKKTSQKRVAQGWRTFALFLLAVLAVILFLQNLGLAWMLVDRLIELVWCAKKELVEILALLVAFKGRGK